MLHDDETSLFLGATRHGEQRMHPLFAHPGFVEDRDVEPHRAAHALRLIREMRACARQHVFDMFGTFDMFDMPTYRSRAARGRRG